MLWFCGVPTALRYVDEVGERGRRASNQVRRATTRGCYESQLATRLRRTDVTMHEAHSNRVHAFAKAYGYEAKPDPRDAPGALAIRTVEVIYTNTTCEHVCHNSPKLSRL